jgi:hypothetical protein
MRQHEREGDSRKEGRHGDDDSRFPGDAGHSAAADQNLLLPDRSQFVTPASSRGPSLYESKGAEACVSRLYEIAGATS